MTVFNFLGLFQESFPGRGLYFSMGGGAEIINVCMKCVYEIINFTNLLDYFLISTLKDALFQFL